MNTLAAIKPVDAQPANDAERPVDVLLERYERITDGNDHSEEFTDTQIAGLANKVVHEYQLDRTSREDWEATAERAMKMARQVKEGKSWPWPNASNVKYPMLTVAALQFAARAYPAIMNGQRVVKCKVNGKDDGGQKADRGDRVSKFMSYQLTEEMPEWEEDLDTLLHQIPIVGCAFKKVYPNPEEESGCASDLISAMDFVVNQKSKHLNKVPRMTHVFTLYPYEIEERRREARFRDVALDVENQDGGQDDQGPQTFLEQHRYWDSDDDGLEEPWIITVHEASQTIVRMVPNFVTEDVAYDDEKIISIKRARYFVKIPFIPDPDGGFYDIGFGKLLESISDIVDTNLNQMLDAATLQNAGGGLMGKGLKLGKSKITRRPGEYTTVDAPGGKIRESVYEFNSPGPSGELFQLLGLMIDAGKDIAATKDVLTGDAGERNMTATTTMALIEQGLKVFSAIFKRIYRSMRLEFKLIYECNRESVTEQQYFEFLDEELAVAPQDFAADMAITPGADPNVITDMQAMVRAQFLLEQVEKGNPHINAHEATKRSLEVANIEDLDTILVNPPEGPDPKEEEAREIELDDKVADIKKKLAEAEKTQVEAANLAAQPITEVVDGQPDAGPGPQGPMPGQEMPPEPTPEQMQMQSDMAGMVPGGDPGFGGMMPEDEEQLYSDDELGVMVAQADAQDGGEAPQ